MNWNALFFETPFFTRLLSTLVLIAVAVSVRTIVVRRLMKKEEVDATSRRRWIVTARNITFLVAFIIIVVIWLEQLRAVAATIVVIAAAIVVATKEFLLNIIGFIYQSTAKFAEVGDRIEIDGIRGDLIDQSMLGFTLMEIGSGEKTNQYTGLTIHVPNVRYLSGIVKNETRMWGDYVFHLITIPIDNTPEWTLSEKALLTAADEVVRPYIHVAKRYMTTRARHQSLDEPNVDPRVNIQMSSPSLLNLILRIPVPTRHRGRVEQEVTRRYMTILDEMKKRQPASSSGEKPAETIDSSESPEPA